MVISDPSAAQAVLYRLVLPDYLCPGGVRALRLLERAGLEVDDIQLVTADLVEQFKAYARVATTPQIYIEGERIGGERELEQWLISADLLVHNS